VHSFRAALEAHNTALLEDSRSIVLAHHALFSGTAGAACIGARAAAPAAASAPAAAAAVKLPSKRQQQQQHATVTLLPAAAKKYQLFSSRQLSQTRAARVSPSTAATSTTAAVS
jgi:hypothetical protein